MDAAGSDGNSSGAVRLLRITAHSREMADLATVKARVAFLWAVFLVVCGAAAALAYFLLPGGTMLGTRIRV